LESISAISVRGIQELPFGRGAPFRFSLAPCKASQIAPQGVKAGVLERDAQDHGALDLPWLPLEGRIDAVAVDGLRSGDRLTRWVERFDVDFAELGVGVEVQALALELEWFRNDLAAIV